MRGVVRGGEGDEEETVLTANNEPHCWSRGGGGAIGRERATTSLSAESDKELFFVFFLPRVALRVMIQHPLSFPQRHFKVSQHCLDVASLGPHYYL